MADKPGGRGLTVPKNPAAMLRALNTRHAGENEETINQTDKPTDQQTNNTTILQTEDPPALETEQGQATEATTPAAAPEPPATPINQSTRQRNKPTKKQTNNTTKVELPPPPIKRDGRTLRSRQPTADPTATIVTSFRISVSTMEALDRFCFENRVRKQDVVEQALAAYMAEDEE